jgi:hypothetical protein
MSGASDFLQRFILNHQYKERVVYPRYISKKILRAFIPTTMREIELSETSFKRFVSTYRKDLIISDDCVIIKLNPIFRIYRSRYFRKGRPRAIRGETIATISRLRAEGYTQQQIGKFVEMPQYQVSRYLAKLKYGAKM